MFTARVIQHWRLVGTYLVPSYPKQFGHTTNTRFEGSRKTFFASGMDSRNNHLQILFFHFHIYVIRRQSGRTKGYTWLHVSLLRPPLRKASSRGGRQFFESVWKNDVKVFLIISTNIIMGQLHIRDQEYDHGITVFWLCENLQIHFHLRLFDF